jgi:hypothetical protein
MARDLQVLQEKEKFCTSWKKVESERLKTIYEQDKKIKPGIDDRAVDFPDWRVGDDYSNLDIVTPWCTPEDTGVTLNVPRVREYQPEYKEKYTDIKQTYERVRSENIEYERILRVCDQETSYLINLLEEERKENANRLPPPPCPEPKVEVREVQVPVEKVVEKVVEKIVEKTPEVPPADSQYGKLNKFCNKHESFYDDYEKVCEPTHIRDPLDVLLVPLQYLNPESWRKNRWIAPARYAIVGLYYLSVVVIILSVLKLIIPPLEFILQGVSSLILEGFDLVSDSFKNDEEKAKERKKNRSRKNKNKRNKNNRNKNKRFGFRLRGGAQIRTIGPVSSIQTTKNKVRNILRVAAVVQFFIVSDTYKNSSTTSIELVKHFDSQSSMGTPTHTPVSEELPKNLQQNISIKTSEKIVYFDFPPKTNDRLNFEMEWLTPLNWDDMFYETKEERPVLDKKLKLEKTTKKKSTRIRKLKKSRVNTLQKLRQQDQLSGRSDPFENAEEITFSVVQPSAIKIKNDSD